jgi:hypothetical protein
MAGYAAATSSSHIALNILEFQCALIVVAMNHNLEAIAYGHFRESACHQNCN